MREASIRYSRYALLDEFLAGAALDGLPNASLDGLLSAHSSQLPTFARLGLKKARGEGQLAGVATRKRRPGARDERQRRGRAGVARRIPLPPAAEFAELTGFDAFMAPAVKKDLT